MPVDQLSGRSLPPNEDQMMEEGRQRHDMMWTQMLSEQPGLAAYLQQMLSARDAERLNIERGFVLPSELQMAADDWFREDEMRTQAHPQEGLPMPPGHQMSRLEEAPPLKDVPDMVALTQPDLPRNPLIKNPDGSFSSERTITIEMDGKHYVIPTIVGGRQLSEDAAVKAFQEGKSRAVGVYGSEKEADKAAKNRSMAGGVISRDKLKFGQAFAEARKAGEKEFVWRGNSYTTKLKEEVKAKSKLPIRKAGGTLEEMDRDYLRWHGVDMGGRNLKGVPGQYSDSTPGDWRDDLLKGLAERGASNSLTLDPGIMKLQSDLHDRGIEIDAETWMTINALLAGRAMPSKRKM